MNYLLFKASSKLFLCDLYQNLTMVETTMTPVHYVDQHHFISLCSHRCLSNLQSWILLEQEIPLYCIYSAHHTRGFWVMTKVTVCYCIFNKIITQPNHTASIELWLICSPIYLLICFKLFLPYRRARFNILTCFCSLRLIKQIAGLIGGEEGSGSYIKFPNSHI